MKKLRGDRGAHLVMGELPGGWRSSLGQEELPEGWRSSLSLEVLWWGGMEELLGCRGTALHHHQGEPVGQ